MQRDVADLRDELARRCAESLCIDIDLGGVTDIDMVGVQWLISLKRMRGCTVHLVNPSGCVLGFLAASKLTVV